MKHLVNITIALASLMAVPAAYGGINAPNAAGYVERGIAFYNDRNYNACIDQLSRLRDIDLTPSQSETALYYLAMATLYSGDDEAIDFLKEFLRDYPASPRFQDATMSCGDYYFTRGSYAEALDAYGDVSTKAFSAGRAADLTYRTAYSHMMLGQNKAARPLFAALYGSKEYGNAARFYTAWLAYDDKNYTEALRLFREVDTNKEPGEAAPYYLAQIHFLYEDYNKALDYALKTLAHNDVPQFAPEANRIAGESLYNLGHTERALPYLWKYAADCTNPQPSTLYILGVSEYEKGNYNEAAALLRKASAAEGTVGQGAWLYLGHTYVNLNNPDAALIAFEKAYTANAEPSLTESAFYNYIVARTEGGRLPFAKTVTMLEDFLQRFPRSRYASTVQEGLVNGYMTDGDYQSALRAIDRVAKPTPALEQARQRVVYELGTRELSAGNPLEAARLLRQAIKGPSAQINRQATLWCADADYAADEYEKAAEGYLAYVEETPATDPNRTLAYYNLGYTRYKQGRYADALIDFRRVVDANPEPQMLADAYTRIADCQYQQRDFANAAANYNRAYNLNHEAGDYALYQLAVMQGLQGNHREQINTLNSVIASYPSSSLAPAAMLDKAEAYAAIGETNNAISVYRDLINEYGNSSYGRQGHLQLAITQNNAGMTNEAIASYKKVIYSFPTSEEAKVAVDDLKRILAAQGKLAELTTFLETVPNSPRLTPSELDALAFQAAETMYLNSSQTSGLEAYLSDYPHGSNEAQALYYLAEDAAEAGNATRALDLATQITLNHPDSEVADDAMLLKADTEAATGKGEIALETYRNLEARAAGSRIITDARLGIMRTALSLGRYSEVLVATDKLKASTASGSADMPEIKYSEAMAYDRLGRRQDAYAIWGDVAKDPNNVFGARSAVAMAESQLKAGKTADAEKTVNAFINANTPHQYWQARAFIVLSDVLRSKGSTFEADEYLRALRKNYPGTEADIFRMIDSRIGK